jgi:hypothetical protein
LTSEVLMLNKDAVVIAADSAVTTGRDPHPRYSKSANKIFDLSVHGNVALTIYSNADVDRVPWELALKLFRRQDSSAPLRPRLDDYLDALIAFLGGNDALFPPAVRSSLLEKRLFRAVVHVLNVAEYAKPTFVDASASAADRTAAWDGGRDAYASVLAAKKPHQLLTDADLKMIEGCEATVQAELATLLPNDAKYLYANAAEVIKLASEALVKDATTFLPSTGLVMAGYGADQIFPSFCHVSVYGHVGSTLLWKRENDYAITHDNDAWIQPFAQSSMIDRFTDGFDGVLSSINSDCSLEFVNSVIRDLSAQGVPIDPLISTPIVGRRHAEFMDDFKKRNWNENFYPLRRVLNSLSVSEMGHLAESLLVLEALRERVTSPSESVGGPIDVAVITKAEGLLWLKRKHFFDPDLNLRYLNRARKP